MKTISISKNKYLIYGFEKEGCHIIPSHYQPKKFSGDTILWLLPVDKNDKSKKIECDSYTVKTKRKETFLWNLDESTLRKAITYGKLVNGVDVGKFGKQWVISIAAMKREYGEPVRM
jgi:hypothetical protein